MAMKRKLLVVYLLESNNEALKNKRSEVVKTSDFLIGEPFFIKYYCFFEGGLGPDGLGGLGGLFPLPVPEGLPVVLG